MAAVDNRRKTERTNGDGPPSGKGVRSFVRGLLRRKPVDDLLDWVRFRIDTFPANVEWLKPLGLPEMHSPTYQELPWVGVRGGRRAAKENSRWEKIEPIVAERDVRSAVDVGANSGFFSFMLAERGVQTVAVEENTRSVRIGLYARKRSGLSAASFLVLSVTPESVELLPWADCALVLSVWHHFVRYHGLKGATRILAGLWARTRKVLFFETGESEMPDWWGLPAMTPDSRAWLTEYLGATCAGSTVHHLGLHDAFDPDDRPCKRNLFAVVRSEDQQQV